MAKTTVAMSKAKADDVLPYRNETPAAVTRAVPKIKCSISVVLNRKLRVRVGSSMLWTPLPLPVCIGMDMALADFRALTRQVSVQS